MRVTGKIDIVTDEAIAEKTELIGYNAEGRELVRVPLVKKWMGYCGSAYATETGRLAFVVITRTGKRPIFSLAYAGHSPTGRGFIVDNLSIVRSSEMRLTSVSFEDSEYGSHN